MGGGGEQRIIKRIAVLFSSLRCKTQIIPTFVHGCCSQCSFSPDWSHCIRSVLGQDILTLIVPLYPQVYKWITTKLKIAIKHCKGGSVASWLLHSTQDRARSLGSSAVLCSWVRPFTPTVLLRLNPGA